MYTRPPRNIADDPLAKNAAYAHPTLACDMVMKGGITSGIAYPRAVCQLARRYRLKNVGGASAGAIAAVAAAAAEYGRRRILAGGQAGAFARLYRIPTEFGSGTTVQGLFRPDRATRGVFEVAFAALKSPFRAFLEAFRRFPTFPLVAAALVLLAIVLAATWDLDWAVVVAVAVFAVGFAIAGVAVQLVRTALTAIPANDFGLCHGGPPDPPDGTAPLTVWLHDVLQDLAGKPSDKPLTFANLWGVSDPEPTATPEEQATRKASVERLAREAPLREINLEVITTNLTLGRPLRLPVPIDPHRRAPVEAGSLLIDIDEWKPFFPLPIIDHLRAHAPQPSVRIAADVQHLAPGRDFRHLTTPELPILVAARLSLSFPILISAMPLWKLRYHEQAEPTLERVWFSDGGISSNFPVHFFDQPLPARPTFALDLVGFDPGDKGDPDDPGHSVRPPDDVAARTPFEGWQSIQSLFGFAVAIKDAMENWRDNAQARLPGFRDRIVHIKIGSGEGGLNLAMEPEKVRELAERGSYAGDQLATLFSKPDLPGRKNRRWNDHRFTRYRVAMSAIERLLRSYERGYAAQADPATIPYSDRIAAGLDGPYAFPSAEVEAFAERTTATYIELVDAWDGDSLDDRRVPRPAAVLREIAPV